MKQYRFTVTVFGNNDGCCLEGSNAGWVSDDHGCSMGFGTVLGDKAQRRWWVFLGQLESAVTAGEVTPAPVHQTEQRALLGL